MKELRPIAVNVDELLAVNKYEVDEESAHIELASDNYSELPAEEWGKLVRVCPAPMMGVQYRCG